MNTTTPDQTMILQHVRTLETGNRVFIFKSLLPVQIEWSEGQQFIVSAPSLNLSAAWWGDEDVAMRELASDLAGTLDGLNREPDDKLTEDAKQLRDKLRSAIQCEVWLDC